jgi:hypothetical protein
LFPQKKHSQYLHKELIYKELFDIPTNLLHVFFVFDSTSNRKGVENQYVNDDLEPNENNK